LRPRQLDRVYSQSDLVHAVAHRTILGPGEGSKFPPIPVTHKHDNELPQALNVIPAVSSSVSSLDVLTFYCRRRLQMNAAKACFRSACEVNLDLADVLVIQ